MTVLSIIPLGDAWSYRNFSEWNSLNASECADGDTQSPIDIILKDVKVDDAFVPLQFHEDLPRLLVDQQANLHTWQVSVPESESTAAGLAWNGKSFFLESFHFHSPSENLFNGHHFDMEAHFVHKAEDGQSLVLAVMLDAHEDQASNDYLAHFWGGFPKNIVDDVPQEIDCPYVSEPKGFLPEDMSYYFYKGSFTTPLCTIDTDWIVLSTPVKMSLAQRDSFRQGINNFVDNQLVVENDTPSGVSLPWNSSLGVDVRPVQALGERHVWTSPDKPVNLISRTTKVTRARHTIATVLIIVASIAFAPSHQ